MRGILLCLSLWCLPAAGQATASALLSPQAAYDKASAPVEIIHRDLANWSEVESSSLVVAVAKAKDACLARALQTFAGDDLIAYARLCALGKQWPNTLTAATGYITSKDIVKPQLALAYAFAVQADLNLGQPKAATSLCFSMMRSVPYGSVADAVTTSTIRYLQFAYLADALDLLTQRQPHLLALLRSSGSAATASDALPMHVLFEHALDLAALQQYNVQPERAAAALAELDRMMPASIPPDESIFITAARRQYALLGTHFPDLPGAVPLLSPTAANRPRYGATTIFLLFPPWCAQCLRQDHEIAQSLFRHADKAVRVYGLLADQAPPPPAKSAPHSTASQRIAQDKIVRSTTGPGEDRRAEVRRRPTPRHTCLRCGAVHPRRLQRDRLSLSHRHRS